MSPPVPRSLVYARGVVVAGAVALTLATAGCTPAPEPGALPSAGGTSASTPTSPEASAPADVVTIAITIADGKVRPSGQRVNVNRGQTVVFTITSDVDEEVHAHDAGDGVEIEAKAGETVTAQMLASDVGSFEVETHSDGLVIVILNVR